MNEKHGHSGDCYHTLTFIEQHAALQMALLENDRLAEVELDYLNKRELIMLRDACNALVAAIQARSAPASS
jgi:hypothetical protein